MTTQGSNTGLMKSIGLEITADYTYQKLGVHGNASWKRILENKTDITEAETDLFVLGDPLFTANATVAYQLLPTLRLHANAHYIGKRHLMLYSYPFLNSYTYEDGYPRVNDVLMFDMGANWSWKCLGVNVNIRNLFGTRYWQTGMNLSYNRSLSGRCVLVELTYKF